MATDRELLESAAKAAGINLVWEVVAHGDPDCEAGEGPVDFSSGVSWNPLNDDATALRLAVKLGMNIHHDDSAAVRVGWAANQFVPFTRDGSGPWHWKEWLRDHAGDVYAATRKAIVRAAATIGEDRP